MNRERAQALLEGLEIAIEGRLRVLRGESSEQGVTHYGMFPQAPLSTMVALERWAKEMRDCLYGSGDRSEHRKYMLEERCVEDPCDGCGGSGVHMYPNTATWRRGGVAGQAFTHDVCDKCWGSGDKHQSWSDLRQLSSRIRMLEEKLAKIHKRATMSENMFVVPDGMLTFLLE